MHISDLELSDEPLAGTDFDLIPANIEEVDQLWQWLNDRSPMPPGAIVH